MQNSSTSSPSNKTDISETDIKDWLPKSSRVIEYAISHCTGKKLFDSGGLLLKILLKIDNIDEMSVLLDREHVDEFCISVDYCIKI
jgi:hypothetical protein